jgi:predicted small lipoprotein YifL
MRQLAAAILIVALAACGQTGPLYLPQQEATPATPPAATEPAESAAATAAP